MCFLLRSRRPNCPPLRPATKMLLSLSHLVSQPLLRCLDDDSGSDYLSQTVQALFASCNQPWFDHIPSEHSKILLEKVATVSLLSLLPAAVLEPEPCQAATDHSSSDFQLRTAYAPFLNFLTVLSKLSGPQTDAATPVPDILTPTALFQSALLASKLLACTVCHPLFPHSNPRVDETPGLLSFIVCMIARQTANHISNSQWSSWAEDELLDRFPTCIVQSCLIFLREVIRNHQQGLDPGTCSSENAADAARSCVAILMALLRPSTQVASKTIEAMYSSGDPAVRSLLDISLELGASQMHCLKDMRPSRCCPGIADVRSTCGWVHTRPPPTCIVQHLSADLLRYVQQGHA